MLLGRGRVRAAHALLEDVATLAPKGQRHGLEVPENGIQGPQEVDAEDEVEAAQVEAAACDGEVLSPDADGDVTGDALATQAIAVGDGDAELRPPVGGSPRRRMVAPWRKLWVEPVSRRAKRRSPLTITGSSIVFSVRIPASAWRDTTRALAAACPWAAGSSGGMAASPSSAGAASSSM